MAKNTGSIVELVHLSIEYFMKRMSYMAQ